jgi:hypothetical protein
VKLVVGTLACATIFGAERSATQNGKIALPHLQARGLQLEYIPIWVYIEVMATTTSHTFRPARSSGTGLVLDEYRNAKYACTTCTSLCASEPNRPGLVEGQKT